MQGFLLFIKIVYEEETSMGLFSKLFKGPEPDMEKSAANGKKVHTFEADNDGKPKAVIWVN